MPEMFTGELPAVPVYKNGHVVYCHNKKELDKWTKPEEEGGPGYVTSYQHQEWPKTMSHPSAPDMRVNNMAELEKYEAQGYSFNHWQNRKMESTAAAPNSFDPKAAAKIQELEAKLANLEKMVESLTAPPKTVEKPQGGRRDAASRTD